MVFHIDKKFAIRREKIKTKTKGTDKWCVFKMGSVFLMNLGLEMYKLYNAIFDVFFKNILFGQVLYLLFHGQSDCFSFLNVKYNEQIRIVLFRITYNYIVTRKKVYENVTYHTMIYRA